MGKLFRHLKETFMQTFVMMRGSEHPIQEVQEIFNKAKVNSKSNKEDENDSVCGHKE